MSPIGRVFIVLNLLLSGLFLGYAAFYLKNHDHYKAMYEAEVARAKAEAEDLRGKLDSKERELTTTTTELRSVSQARDQLGTQLKAAMEENSDTKSRMNANQEKLTSLEAKMGTVSTTIDNQNKRLEELTKSWLAAKDEMEKAVAARDDAVDKLRAAEASLAKSKEREAALVAENNEKSVENRKLALELDVIKDTFPDAAIIAARALPEAHGTIMDVNSDLGTVTISLGENQAGVKKGWEFAVHDGANYKGQIRITSVSANMGFGRVMKAVPGQTIQKGDKASTRLPR